MATAVEELALSFQCSVHLTRRYGLSVSVFSFNFRDFKSALIVKTVCIFWDELETGPGFIFLPAITGSIIHQVVDFLLSKSPTWHHSESRRVSVSWAQVTWWHGQRKRRWVLSSRFCASLRLSRVSGRSDCVIWALLGSNTGLKGCRSVAPAALYYTVFG